MTRYILYIFHFTSHQITALTSSAQICTLTTAQLTKKEVPVLTDRFFILNMHDHGYDQGEDINLTFYHFIYFSDLHKALTAERPRSLQVDRLKYLS